MDVQTLNVGLKVHTTKVRGALNIELSCSSFTHARAVASGATRAYCVRALRTAAPLSSRTVQ